MNVLHEGLLYPLRILTVEALKLLKYVLARANLGTTMRAAQTNENTKKGEIVLACYGVCFCQIWILTKFQ